MVFEAAVRGARKVVRRTGGVIVKAEADSLLLMYADAGRACRGVFALEDYLARFNRGRPRNEQARFSYGIGYGDVLDLDDDTFGPEVNLASKIGEDVAKPGEILLTDAAAASLSAAFRRRLLPHAPVRLRGRTVTVHRLRGRGRS
jgi:class 3 adenylate cyclase